MESDRIPETAYYRIAIPELFRDKGLERILYLDCDMIALTDISELWEVDLSGYILAAVEDAGFHHRLEKMAVACDSTKYFNSGFMLINMEKWLSENVTKRVLRYIHDNPEKLKFHDQDALNAILHDQWLQLHPKWNAQSYIMKREVEHPDPEGKRNIFKPDATLRSSIILDISNLGVKCTSSLKKYYEEYEELTAFTEDDEGEKASLNTASTRKLG